MTGGSAPSVAALRRACAPSPHHVDSVMLSAPVFGRLAELEVLEFPQILRNQAC